MVTEEVTPTSYRSAEDQVRACYSIRTLDRFLHFMGLASIEKIPNDKAVSREYQIKKMPLLDEVVRFSV